MNIKEIKGVGDVVAKKLQSLGIDSVEELLEFYPKNILDMTKETTLSKDSVGDYVLLCGEVVKITKLVRINKMLNMFRVEISCQNQAVKMVWFNTPYLINNIKIDEKYYFWSKLTYKDGCYELINPSFENAQNRQRLIGLVPVYPLKNIIKQKTFCGYVEQALKILEPTSIVDNYEILNIAQAHSMIHKPTNFDDYAIAQDRLATEQLTLEIIAHRIVKNNCNNKKIRKFQKSIKQIEKFLEMLPYELTDSQSIAIKEIIGDLQGEEKTNRMLVGDVGSGKTVVALASIVYSIKCGYQCVLMTPTAVLSVQHYHTAKQLLEPLGITVEILLGSTTASKRRKILQDCKEGKINLLIGTHAVIGDKVEFGNLGFVVIDELHKFGVRQKSLLENKGNGAEVLIMSATPIPRVVALACYGDVEISNLSPRKKQNNVSTHIIGENKLQGMYNFILERTLAGEQAYIVCPTIEDSEGLEIYSAKNVYEDIQIMLPQLEISLVHGKQSDKVKQDIMQKFMSNTIKVLVATSVIEVGIDCKNASVIAILNADRFGLASLHQLRGRVGREPTMKSYCFLHTAKEQENERLNILKNNDDGNKIAELDAQLRGYGDFLGIRQSGGQSSLNFNKNIIEKTKLIADKILTNNYEEAISNNKVVKMLKDMNCISLT